MPLNQLKFAPIVQQLLELSVFNLNNYQHNQLHQQLPCVMYIHPVKVKLLAKLIVK